MASISFGIVLYFYYFILFFLTLVWTSLDNCISQKKKQQDVTLCNIVHAKLVLRNSSFKSSLYLQWQWDLCITVEKSPIFVGNKFKIYCLYDWPWLWLIVCIIKHYSLRNQPWKNSSFLNNAQWNKIAIKLGEIFMPIKLMWFINCRSKHEFKPGTHWGFKWVLQVLFDLKPQWVHSRFWSWV